MATTIDSESRDLLQQISRDFIIFGPESSAPVAYHIESGGRQGKDFFIQFCAKHYGDVVFIDENGNETDRTSSGVIWWNWNDYSRRVARQIVMEPTNKPEDDSDPEKFNRWYVLRKTMVEPDFNSTPEDAAPFINHLMQISDGDQVGVMFFLNWLAQLYQFPETKMPVAIMMYSQYGGVGKNLIQRLLSRVFGKPLVAGVSGKRLQSNFMDAIEHKRLVFINELAKSDKADGYEDFKTQVSEEDTQFEGKGRAAKEIKNITHYIITTNNIDCLPLMQNDRRIAVLMSTAKPLGEEYFRLLVKWIDGPGAPIVANLLRTWQFPADWNPHAPAPQTEAALAVQKEARGALEQLVEQLIEEHLPPFDKDVGRAMDLCVQLSTLYGNSLTKNVAPNNKTLPKILGKVRGVQYMNISYAKTDGVKTSARVWCWRNQEKWAAMSNQQVAEAMGITKT